ncbi:uncharacterized protein EDB93DRAFT_1106601 [Suillus bovinus]|uniref:uncharacterized protein n=1 Tax=Suillus bovinus TaxID=48563 RepID=UPI001B86DAF3|nr:uncharacterized protein EDB93DRAFT_1106601 [Suillus bovinus]KAG2137394.1 hypothetical protein EDB93DRAFT_1106601 [Suillus bovinus]
MKFISLTIMMMSAAMPVLSGTMTAQEDPNRMSCGRPGQYECGYFSSYNNGNSFVFFCSEDKKTSVVVKCDKCPQCCDVGKASDGRWHRKADLTKCLSACVSAAQHDGLDMIDAEPTMYQVQFLIVPFVFSDVGQMVYGSSDFELAVVERTCFSAGGSDGGPQPVRERAEVGCEGGWQV